MEKQRKRPLPKDKVDAIRGCVNLGMKQSEIVKECDVNASTVSRIINGKAFTSSKTQRNKSLQGVTHQELEELRGLLSEQGKALKEHSKGLQEIKILREKLDDIEDSLENISKRLKKLETIVNP